MSQLIDRILRRRHHYRRIFINADGALNQSGRVVLGDLQRFCYGNAPTIRAGSTGIDPLASVAAAARQEVWLRIINHLHLDDAQLLNLKENANE